MNYKAVVYFCFLSVSLHKDFQDAQKPLGEWHLHATSL